MTDEELAKRYQDFWDRNFRGIPRGTMPARGTTSTEHPPTERIMPLPPKDAPQPPTPHTEREIGEDDGDE